MEEIERLTIELLHEFDGMSPETIEDLRIEWIDQLKAGDAERYQRVEGFVNAVCDVAIDRETIRSSINMRGDTFGG